MDTRTSVGWPIDISKLSELYTKLGNELGISTPGGLSLLSLRHIMKRSLGCSVDFFMMRSDNPDLDNKCIMTIYEGRSNREEINIDEILNRYPPIFDSIRTDLNITGEPQFYQCYGASYII